MTDFRKRWLDLYPREKPDTRVFEFITNQDGKLRQNDLSYADYLANDELRRRMWDKNVYRLVLGRRVFLVEKKWLESSPEDKDLIMAFEAHSLACPLHYWAPHTDVDVDFLNDDTATVKMAIMMNRRGKTVLGVIDITLDLVPCDEKWWMFEKYGVKIRDWTGKKTAGCSTYTMGHHQKTTYQEIVKWTPRKFLGSFSKNTERVGKMRVEPSWAKSNPQIPLVHCGSKWMFFSYEQGQEAYEGGVVHRPLWDEQGQENLFDAMDRATTSVMGRHDFCLTPHKIPGRPDTGAGSWIHKMARGEMTKGHNVHVYHANLLDVPDWVYPEATKEKEWVKWVEEPERTGNHKMAREGKSRLFGEWHVTAGLVYDEIVPEVHFIEPFPITREYTLYRAIDHGGKNPTACLWAAVDKDGFIYLYREYYAGGKSIPQNCKLIIELSGATRRASEKFFDVDTGDELQRYEEIPGDEVYVKTVLDSRSFSTGEGSGRPIQWLYRASGVLVQKASGKQDKDRIPMVKALLEIDKDRRNPITGKMGSPRMFIFNTLEWFKKEWQGYVWEEYGTNADTKNPKEKARDKENHAMTALAFLCQIPPRYMGDMPGMERGASTSEQPVDDHEHNPTTGY